MRLPREAIARRLATTPGTIEDLENGALSSLPHWRETVRIVRGYCEILRLDPQPILWRMQSQWDAACLDDDPPTRSNGTRPQGPPPAALRKEARTKPPAGPARGAGRARMFALSAPLALAAGAFYVAQTAPAPIYRAIALLPQAVAGTARAGMDNLVLYSAPRRDGLQMDRRRRSPVAQSRQIADKQPIAYAGSPVAQPRQPRARHFRRHLRR